MDHFQENLAKAKQALAEMEEGSMDKPFSLKANNKAPQLLKAKVTSHLATK